MNKTFGGRNSSTPRSRRYYGNNYAPGTYESTSCLKEERVTLHIPADRLEAARFDGLSIALLDRYGDDIPLYIPPNYIEGFAKANPYQRQFTQTRVTPGYGSNYGSGVSQPGQIVPGAYPTNPGN